MLVFGRPLPLKEYSPPVNRALVGVLAKVLVTAETRYINKNGSSCICCLSFFKLQASNIFLLSVMLLFDRSMSRIDKTWFDSNIASFLPGFHQPILSAPIAELLCHNNPPTVSQHSYLKSVISGGENVLC